MEQEVIYDLKGRCLYLIINREAKNNALSVPVLESLIGHLQDAMGRDDVMCVCITGAGERIFSAGADLSMTRNGSVQNMESATEKYANLLKLMAGFEKPLIARVNGSCMGGGLGIMLSCDIAIARNNAYFWTPEPDIGLFPMMIGPLLYEHMGVKLLMEMILTGRRLSAQEAVSHGLITKAVPPDELDDTIEDIVKAMEKKSLIAIRHGKRAFSKIRDMTFSEALDLLRSAFIELISTDEARAGIKAFFEKRRSRVKRT